MKHQNFNLLNHETLIQLGFNEKELAKIDDLRPLPNIFHLTKIESITPQRVGELLKQGIRIGAVDASLVPCEKNTTVGENEVINDDLECLCSDKHDDVTEGTGFKKMGSNLDEDPFGIFEPFCPRELIQINDCDKVREVLLAGLGFVREVVDLNGLTPRQEFRKITRSVEFVTRLARVRARGSLRKSTLRIIENARNICKNPKCPDPSVTFGRERVEEVFSLVLPAINPDGTPKPNVFVLLVLYMASQSLFISCTNRS